MLRTLYPDLCIACDNMAKAQTSSFCVQCLHELPYTDHFRIKNNSLINRLAGRVPLEHAGALLYFRERGPVQRILHKLKYGHDIKAGVIIGDLLAREILSSPFVHKVDMIVPVPIHESRRRERGYNQCEIIANAFSEKCGIPVVNDVIIKNIHNESQTGKNRMERIENVRLAYTLNPLRQIEGMNILVLDDVVTTGATVEACCLELLKGNPSSIYVAALASEE